MNILVAMLLTSFTSIAKKVWGQDLVDKAVTEVILYLLDKWNDLVPSERDDVFIEHVKRKISQ